MPRMGYKGEIYIHDGTNFVKLIHAQDMSVDFSFNEIEATDDACQGWELTERGLGKIQIDGAIKHHPELDPDVPFELLEAAAIAAPDDDAGKIKVQFCDNAVATADTRKYICWMTVTKWAQDRKTKEKQIYNFTLKLTPPPAASTGDAPVTRTVVT